MTQETTVNPQQQQAVTEENVLIQTALLTHLQQRVVTLNVELQDARAKIAELQEQVASSETM